MVRFRSAVGYSLRAPEARWSHRRSRLVVASGPSRPLRPRSYRRQSRILHARRAARQRVGRAGLRPFLEAGRARAGRDLRQGGPGLGVRARARATPTSSSRSRSGPAYLTAERIAKAPNLKLAMTAGIGSDHVDLDAAIAHGVTVAEVTYCNSISVSEHVVMMILGARAQLHPVVPDGRGRAAGTSPTASRGPTTSRACRSAPSPPGGSARPCCAG